MGEPLAMWDIPVILPRLWVVLPIHLFLVTHRDIYHLLTKSTAEVPWDRGCHILITCSNDSWCILK